MVESLTCFCWQASSAAVGVWKESGRFEEEKSECWNQVYTMVLYNQYQELTFGFQFHWIENYELGL